ncbi:type VI secretion system contractile sheath large subunit, partial [Escherichia coli]|nr:type VI secretion system contractile sheath large subunit [Escherichia coli]MCF4060074.1 type VI secretion system contractile sheath large subunit [Escherichia coli]
MSPDACLSYIVGTQYTRLKNVNLSVIGKRLVRTVLIFTESSDQLSRATDRVPGLPASPGYVQ